MDTVSPDPTKPPKSKTWVLDLTGKALASIVAAFVVAGLGAAATLLVQRGFARAPRLDAVLTEPFQDSSGHRLQLLLIANRGNSPSEDNMIYIEGWPRGKGTTDYCINYIGRFTQTRDDMTLTLSLKSIAPNDNVVLVCEVGQGELSRRSITVKHKGGVVRIRYSSFKSMTVQ